MGSSHSQPRRELLPTWVRLLFEHVDPPPRTIRLRVLEILVNELQVPGARLLAAREHPTRDCERRESIAARLRAAANPTRTASASLPISTSSRGLEIWTSRGCQQTKTAQTVSMPALFSGPASPPTSSTEPSSAATKQPSPPADPAPSSSSLSSFPRRIESKSSLRSTSSNNDDDDDNSIAHDKSGGSDQNSLPAPRSSVLRRLSPGLAARVKLLDGQAKAALNLNRTRNVGKIPQDQIKELDSLHQDLSIKVERRGRTWTGRRSTQAKRDESVPSQPDTPLPVTKEEDELQTPVQEESGDLPVPAADSDRTVSRADPASEPVASGDVRVFNETDDHQDDMAVAEPAPVPERPSSGSNGVESQPDQTDFEKYVKSTAEQEDNADQPPPPPPKDSSRPTSISSNPLGLHRTESIYSFSRASFSSQLSQLTSITLPQPSTLEASITAIPNAPAAVKALTGAAEQIKIWINKASDVLGGLDAENDVEWAAAAGREGLDDVDKAVTTFESLVNVYVRAIENVQLREDIGNVSGDSLKDIVVQMESILKRWAQVRSQLKGVKEQVELAMEWEELWSNVLGDVSLEVDSLSRLIFEMEEKRHMTMTAEPGTEHTNGLDINELETIVEESPGNERTPSNKRFSFPAFAEGSLIGGPVSSKTPQDDLNSSLMALFARMQPLRASLDFLPMRLSMFQSRAENIFPSACEELEDRRNRLEKSYKKLETDAEALRKELGEDRWILVFRNAGRQAEKMFESVERSISKLQEALDTGAHIHNQAGLAKRIESFEAKKVHYTPAIERVVSIIQKGVNDRLTVNGEVLRLLSDMESRLDALRASMKVMDGLLEDLNLNASQQLRDSISSIITMDSPATGSAVDTPGSSPASSVIMSGNGMKSVSTPSAASRRGSSVGSSAATSKTKRYSSLPQPVSTFSSKRASSIPRSSVTSPTRSSLTPTAASRMPPRGPSPAPKNNKPRWNSSTNTNDLDVGHRFKPISATTPSPHRKPPVPRLSRRSSSSTMALPSPLGCEASASPAPGMRSGSRAGSRAASRLASPTPSRLLSPTPTGSLLDPPPYSKLRKQPSFADIPTGRRNRQSFAGISFTRTPANDQDMKGASSKVSRPETALGHSSNNKRSSMLPLPKSRSGRDSSASSRSKLDERPPWR
ncbi:hypothetical protein VTN00DRAFT_4704 [Thermoascus crustaceus]|uniref:uncharacterized protein n=1 Tax=Thermoascus crustaceus TaxID=5088 RepID=UPI0037443637